MKKVLKISILILLSATLVSIVSKQKSDFSLIIFEGSDWCSNCRRLEKNVLVKPGFKTFLTEKGISVKKIDFPQRKKLGKEEKKRNAELAEKYEFSGDFPTILISRNDTLLFKRITYINESETQMIDKINAQLSILK